MTSITLTYTENIGSDVAASFDAVARTYLPIEGSPKTYVRLSGAELPAVIQLIGSVAGWLTLATATGYFGQLGVKAADFTLKKAKKAFRQQKDDPLTRVALAMSNAKRTLGDNAKIIIGIDIPDNHFGTSLTIECADPEQIAYELGNFILKAARIAAFVENEMATWAGSAWQSVYCF